MLAHCWTQLTVSPSSTACLHRRPVQTNPSPAISPRVGPRARTEAIGTVLRQRLRCEAGIVRRGTSGGARGPCGGTSGSGCRVPYGHGHVSEHKTHLLFSFQLSRTLREEGAVKGEFTIYGEYILVIKCFRYLLIAGLKLYLSIFKSKPFPLRPGK